MPIFQKYHFFKRLRNLRTLFFGIILVNLFFLLIFAFFRDDVYECQLINGRSIHVAVPLYFNKKEIHRKASMVCYHFLDSGLGCMVKSCSETEKTHERVR